MGRGNHGCELLWTVDHKLWTVGIMDPITMENYGNYGELWKLWKGGIMDVNYYGLWIINYGLWGSGIHHGSNYYGELWKGGIMDVNYYGLWGSGIQLDLIMSWSLYGCDQLDHGGSCQ
ncbi:hypothetical protein SUGI_0585850 [Cryptomeria japonica]|nr:hypothetical protein SUGI_0585850 [Cryptomeria japonica]